MVSIVRVLAKAAVVEKAVVLRKEVMTSEHVVAMAITSRTTGSSQDSMIKDELTAMAVITSRSAKDLGTSQTMDLTEEDITVDGWDISNGGFPSLAAKWPEVLVGCGKLTVLQL